MTIAHMPASAPTTVTWTRVTDGLWAASSRDAFLGTVEAVDGAYLAVDGTGATVGTFADLAAAQRHVLDPAPSVGPAPRRRAPFASALAPLRRLATRRSARMGA